MEAAREFRWAAVDPYVRRHGASRLNLWGGLLGSVVWLPILAVVLVVEGGFDLTLVLALALPYVAILGWLAPRRAHTPALLWMMLLWSALGAYFCYVWALLVARPEWGRAFATAGTHSAPPRVLGIMGAVWMVTGFTGAVLYRRHAMRVPRLSGTPPINQP